MTTLRTIVPGAILGGFMLAGCAAAATPGPPSAASTLAASAPATPAATTTAASPSLTINLTGLDGCALLDEQTIRGLTGWPGDVRIATQRGSATPPNELGCFWGAAQAGVPGYVEIVVSRGTALTRPFTGCSIVPVTGIGTEARTATCPNGVFLEALDRGARVSLQVQSKTPGDLGSAVKKVLQQIPR